MKHFPAAAACILLTLAAGGCGTSGVNKKAYDFRSSSGKQDAFRAENLSHEMSWLRSRQVGKVTYILWFGLDEQNESYDGRVVVNFELKDLKKTLPKELIRELKDLAQVIALDFEGGTVNSLSINGVPINLDEKDSRFAKRFDGHRIYLHTSELVSSGSNRVEISFSQRFSTRGQGFHRFKDPVDGSVYLYTNSEPYHAHLIFPCFDQPDIKASYELAVEAPRDWQVIANTLEREITTVDGRKSWAFPPSPVFSTYLFEVAAGPYAMWKSDAKGLPLRLFARQSLKGDVDHAEWFDTTKKGLEFYNNYFGYPYPYAKYDQIIVPEFNAGAMENAAAITFSERSVLPVRRTMQKKRGRADTILHEMAHQWFGDLVTMRWWNGLWLNESFATYMSSKALAAVTKFPGIWDEFYAGEKSWAYWEDQLVTTHPIEVPVPDTETAESNFDGITYGKGAAVLKQLAFYLGEDDFREGLQRYFMKYALRNATTHEFMKILGEASGKDLSNWQRLWLQTAGVNGLRADWTCADGEISQFKLVQTPANEGSKDLRPHRTRVAFYNLSKGKVSLRTKDVLDVSYSQAETVVEGALGRKCPDFVFPNFEDHDYVDVELDPKSLEFARAHLNRFDAPGMRLVIWSSLWNRVVEGKLKPQEMLDSILTLAPNEKNADVLLKLVELSTTTHLNDSGLLTYLPREIRGDYLEKVEAMALKALRSAQPGSDLQKIWWDGLLSVSHSRPAVEYLRNLLDGKAKLSGFPIRQHERWSLISALTRANESDATALIETELKKDPSDLGLRSSLSARASAADPALKQKWMGYFLSGLNGKPIKTDEGVFLNSSRLKEAARAYLSLFREEGAKDIAERYFSSLPRLRELSDDPFAESFARWLYPGVCDPKLIERTSAAISTIRGLPPSIEKTLKIQKQEQERCVRARAKALEAAPHSLSSNSTGQ